MRKNNDAFKLRKVGEVILDTEKERYFLIIFIFYLIIGLI